MAGEAGKGVWGAVCLLPPPPQTPGPAAANTLGRAAESSSPRKRKERSGKRERQCGCWHPTFWHALQSEAPQTAGSRQLHGRTGLPDVSGPTGLVHARPDGPPEHEPGVGGRGRNRSRDQHTRPQTSPRTRPGRRGLFHTRTGHPETGAARQEGGLAGMQHAGAEAQTFPKDLEREV